MYEHLRDHVCLCYTCLRHARCLISLLTCSDCILEAKISWHSIPGPPWIHKLLVGYWENQLEFQVDQPSWITSTQVVGDLGMHVYKS
ncbi:hypothetical protein AOLI_G00109490 [Acnodon oligacanthus]